MFMCAHMCVYRKKWDENKYIEKERERERGGGEVCACIFVCMWRKKGYENESIKRERDRMRWGRIYACKEGKREDEN